MGKKASFVVTVFGNPLEPRDNLAVQLVPQLQQQLPDYRFVVADPTENLEPVNDPWIILDVGMGIDTVVVIDELEQLEYVKGQSVHDFDVYMELRLRQKLGNLPQIRLVIVPYTMDEATALRHIRKSLRQLTSSL